MKHKKVFALLVTVSSLAVSACNLLPTGFSARGRSRQEDVSSLEPSSLQPSSLLPSSSDNRTSSNGSSQAPSSSRTSSTYSQHKHTYGEWQTVLEATCEADGKKQRSCSICGETQEDTIRALGHEYGEATEVAFGVFESQCSRCHRTVDASSEYCSVWFRNSNSGDYTLKRAVRKGEAVDRPQSVTPPAGKRFLGWMNTNNGGQIWNFDNPRLNVATDNMLFEPCFVNSYEPQAFEAELDPQITEANNGQGMMGRTYSGGQISTGLIGKDYEHELNASGNYISDDFTGTIRYADSHDNTGDTFGAFVHFFYVRNNTLTFTIYSDERIENVALLARFSAEYGKENEFDDGRFYSSFSDSQFEIRVNSVPIRYGNISLFTDERISVMPFQDFLLSSNITLYPGNNMITFSVQNDKEIMTMIESTAPVIDCIKLYSRSVLRWEDEKVDNLNRDGSTHTHDFSEWEEQKSASCTDNGSAIRTCSICRKVEKRALVAYGHDYQDVPQESDAYYVAPTVDAPGQRSVVCSRCHAVSVVEIPKLVPEVTFTNIYLEKEGTNDIYLRVFGEEYLYDKNNFKLAFGLLNVQNYEMAIGTLEPTAINYKYTPQFDADPINPERPSFNLSIKISDKADVLVGNLYQIYLGAEGTYGPIDIAFTTTPIATNSYYYYFRCDRMVDDHLCIGVNARAPFELADVSVGHNEMTDEYHLSISGPLKNQNLSDDEIYEITRSSIYVNFQEMTNWSTFEIDPSDIEIMRETRGDGVKRICIHINIGFMFERRDARYLMHLNYNGDSEADYPFDAEFSTKYNVEGQSAYVTVTSNLTGEPGNDNAWHNLSILVEHY